MGRRRRSRRIGLAIASLLVLTACAPREAPIDRYLSEYGGARAQYERIAEMDDCASVQAEYDSAAANHDVAQPNTEAESINAGYMAAAEDRLEELDCPRR